MKPLRRRLIIHFSLQSIAMAFLMFAIIFVLLLTAIQLMAEDEMKLNYPQGAINNMMSDTVIENGKAELSSGWKEQLKEKKMWVQVLNEDGKVITSSNAPDSLPLQYSEQDLLLIDKTKMWNDFSIFYSMETAYKNPYLYILGFKDEKMVLLRNLAEQYPDGSLTGQLAEVEVKLREIKGSLSILDPDGHIVQSAGKMPEGTERHALEVIHAKIAPGSYTTNTASYTDHDTGLSWLLYTPNEETDNNVPILLEDAWRVLLIITIVFLLLTLAVSFWNGLRYGQPLLIFTSWLSRMGSEQYDEVLTDAEQRKIFKKNGKVRLRYRLYKEMITAFYDMAARLKASGEERRLLEKTQEEWMSGISHDLRTPLSTIHGYGHLLESGQYEWTERELRDMGSMIRSKGDYMVKLIEDFSLSFRLKNKALSLQTASMDLDHFLASAVRRFSGDKTLQDYQFRYISSGIPVYWQIDERWFQRILDNLVYNGVKHNPQGTKITVRLQKQPDSLLLSVEDNGRGMDAATLEQLFSRYYRGVNTEEQIEGSGLGMSIARQLAGLHGGTITAKSRAGEGTVILLTFHESDSYSSSDGV